MSEQCPVSSHRRTDYPGETTAQGVSQADGVWQVRSMSAVRQVLRSRDTVQAGFNAEALHASRLRWPVIYLDGEPHREQRAAIARYFAPKTVDTRYHQVMADCSDALVSELQRNGTMDLAEAAMRYSVMVAAEVIGLTESDRASMAKRLARFFAMPAVPAERGDDHAMRQPRSLRRLATGATLFLRGNLPMVGFYLRDVRPAISSRRRTRRDDVISHLVDAGYRDAEILIECITYGAAGMITTREFISLAMWQLLQHDELRRRYLAGDQAQRHQVLQEVLRLDPVVGHLYRRTTAPLELVDDDGRQHVVPQGALLDLHIRNANADPAVVGADAHLLCPGRSLPPRVGAEVASFGDGPHKCPGNALAIQESDELLRRLLRLPVRLATRPVVGWDELVKGYQVRNIRLVLDQAAPAAA